MRRFHLQLKLRFAEPIEALGFRVERLRLVRIPLQFMHPGVGEDGRPLNPHDDGSGTYGSGGTGGTPDVGSLVWGLRHSVSKQQSDLEFARRVSESNFQVAREYKEDVERLEILYISEFGKSKDAPEDNNIDLPVAELWRQFLRLLTCRRRCE